MIRFDILATGLHEFADGYLWPVFSREPDQVFERKQSNLGFSGYLFWAFFQNVRGAFPVTRVH